MTLNNVPFVSNNEPLLGGLDRLREGRSHMAIVSQFDVDRAKSVKKAVKQSLTQRVRQAVGVSDDSSSSSGSEDSREETGSTGAGGSRLKRRRNAPSDGSTDRDVTQRGKPDLENDKDGDRSGGEAPEPDTGKLRFRLRRKKGGKRIRKHVVRRRSLGISRWARFLMTRTREGFWDLDYRRENRPLPLTPFWPSRVPTRSVLGFSTRFCRKLTCRTQSCRSWMPRSRTWESSPLKRFSKVGTRRVPLLTDANARR